MEKLSSWVPSAGALTLLLLLVGSGCMKDLDSLSANYGSGGAGNAGRAGSSHTGGSSASGGDMNAGEGGVAGEGEGGEAGSQEPSTGGQGTAGHGGSAPSGGRGGSGGSCEDQGLAKCDGVKECVDLGVGTPNDNGVDNCGMCGKSCDLTGASSATCAAAACALVCNSGLGDCNASTDNDGCEVFFDALDHCTTSCTGTSVACDPTQVCNAGICGAAAGLTVFNTPLTS